MFDCASSVMTSWFGSFANPGAKDGDGFQPLVSEDDFREGGSVMESEEDFAARSTGATLVRWTIRVDECGRLEFARHLGDAADPGRESRRVQATWGSPIGGIVVVPSPDVRFCPHVAPGVLSRMVA